MKNESSDKFYLPGYFVRTKSSNIHSWISVLWFEENVMKVS